MSHALEQNEDGTYKMVYCGQVPWHGLGNKVPYGLTPEQFCAEGGLDYTVTKSEPFSVTLDGHTYKSSKCALIRSDMKGLGAVIGEVSTDWNIIQNIEAAKFFNGMIAAGDAEMETAGSLHNGEIVWFMAKMKESFALFKGKDEINTYMVFTNPFKYAMSQSTMITSVRVVCQNTQRLAYEEATLAGDIVRHRHRTAFSADKTLMKLGVAKATVAKYKEQAILLSKKKAKKEDIVEYLKRVLPAYQNKSGKPMSKNAELALSILDTQPGAELGAGTWWQPYNAVTFLIDHHIGRSDDSRMENAWYGPGVKVKDNALKIAVEYAEAA